MLVIFSWDDRMLTAGPAVDFARHVRADTLSISSPSGHTASVCEQARIGVAVREFLRGDAFPSPGGQQTSLLCRPLSQNPPHQGYGKKRKHIKDAVPGRALGLGEVPIA